MKWWRTVCVVLGILAFGGLECSADVDPFYYHGQEPAAMWTYKEAGGKDLQMHVYLPDDYAEDKTFPAILLFHGGSWDTGSPSAHYPDCVYWSKRGMIAASVGYRLRTRDNVQVPLECVKDAKSAIRFLRKNAADLKIDPDRIVAAGGSAGGQLAAATAMITDKESNDDTYDLSISSVPNAVVGFNPWFRCKPELNPQDNVTSGLPPTIVFHGSEDPLPVPEMKAFHDKMVAAGNVSAFYVGKGGKHGFCVGLNPHKPFSYWAVETTDRFLVKHGILTGQDNLKRPKGLKKVSYMPYIGPDVVWYDFCVPAFKNGARILFQGDSVTDMGWDRKADPNDTKKYLGHCYVRFASEQINAKKPDTQFLFINRGIQGNTVADLRSRWQRDALDLKPDVLSILIGVNDVAKKGLQAESFERDYRTILEQSRETYPDLKIILLDPLAVKIGTEDQDHYKNWNRPRARMDEFRAIVCKLAREFDAVHVRTQDAFDAAIKVSSGGDWLHDGIHPTGRGHRLITKQWLEAVSERWPLEKQEDCK